MNRLSELLNISHRHDRPKSKDLLLNPNYENWLTEEFMKEVAGLCNSRKIPIIQQIEPILYQLFNESSLRAMGLQISVAKEYVGVSRKIPCVITSVSHELDANRSNFGIFEQAEIKPLALGLYNYFRQFGMQPLSDVLDNSVLYAFSWRDGDAPTFDGKPDNQRMTIECYLSGEAAGNCMAAPCSGGFKSFGNLYDPNDLPDFGRLLAQIKSGRFAVPGPMNSSSSTRGLPVHMGGRTFSHFNGNSR